MPFTADEIAKKFNMNVLRTPPYQCEFIPIEFNPKDMKPFLESNHSELTPSHIDNLITQFQEKYSQSTKMNQLQHVLHNEQEYTTYINLEDESAPLIINLSDTDSDSE